MEYRQELPPNSNPFIRPPMSAKELEYLQKLQDALAKEERKRVEKLMRREVGTKRVAPIFETLQRMDDACRAAGIEP